MYPVSYGIHPEVKASVFEYFYDAYLDWFRKDLLAKFPAILQQYPDYSIIFTGHSLGATMTAHMASDFFLLGSLNNRSVKLITFGQPRVGDPHFNNVFKRPNVEFYRLTHYHDIVPHLPPCLAGLKGVCWSSGILPFYPYHNPQEIWYNEPSDSYKVCSATDGEDPNCSKSELSDSVNDHYYYLGIDIGKLSGQWTL